VVSDKLYESLTIPEERKKCTDKQKKEERCDHNVERKERKGNEKTDLEEATAEMTFLLYRIPLTALSTRFFRLNS
jgi:hypothetical protein